MHDYRDTSNVPERCVVSLSLQVPLAVLPATLPSTTTVYEPPVAVDVKSLPETVPVIANTTPATPICPEKVPPLCSFTAISMLRVSFDGTVCTRVPVHVPTIDTLPSPSKLQPTKTAKAQRNIADRFDNILEIITTDKHYSHRTFVVNCYDGTVRLTRYRN